MKRNTAAALRAPLGFLTTLGLLDPDLAGWDKVRAARLGDLRRMLPFAWAATVFNAFALCAVLWDTVPRGQALAWLATLLMLVAYSVHARLRGGTTSPDRTMTARVTRAGLCATLAGIVWAVPPVVFVSGQAADLEVAVCLILGAVIAGAPLTLAAIPLGMCGYMLPIAFGLAVMMARTGSPLLTALPLIYVVALLIGGLAVSRGALRRRLAETVLDDESETVSLLLHEFADEESHWLWETDARKRLAHATPRIAAALGRPEHAVADRSFIALLTEGWPGGHAPEHRALLDLLDSRISFHDYWLPLMVDGEQRWWRLSAMPRYASDGRFTGFRGVGADVTGQRRRIERMDRLASADALTGIDNRTGFTRRLDRAIAHAGQMRTSCGLLLIDLDRFKAVNDTYGHPVGDRLLQAAAARIAALTTRDGACGRLGGDEFAMLVADAGDSQPLAALARRVQAALLEPFEVDGRMLHVGASIGVAASPHDGESVAALMRNADVALYRAKREGGRPCHYAPAMHDRDTRQAALIADLPHALDGGQLTLGFAPVAAAADRRLVAFSAVTTWRHPRLGIVSDEEMRDLPASAHPLAAIGEWLLQSAMQEASRWPEDVRLLIGLSPAQIRDPRSAMMIRAAQAMSGLSAGRLVLGVPEAVALDPGARVAIDALRATGAGLMIDGFETGFAALRGGRFAAVRIAPRLIEEAGDGGGEATGLVRALAAMAETLDVATLAPAAGSPHAGARALARG
ncbi:MAG: diguanylate cyclase, partial [Sphingomonas sp.]